MVRRSHASEPLGRSVRGRLGICAAHGLFARVRPAAIRTIAHLVPDACPFLAPDERALALGAGFLWQIRLAAHSGHRVPRSLACRCQACAAAAPAVYRRRDGMPGVASADDAGRRRQPPVWTRRISRRRARSCAHPPNPLTGLRQSHSAARRVPDAGHRRIRLHRHHRSHMWRRPCR